MAVYGGPELAPRSAETFNDMVSSSHSSGCLYASVEPDLGALPTQGRAASHSVDHDLGQAA